MATRAEYAHRKRRESLSKRLGSVALRIKARDGHKCVYCHADEASEIRAGRHLHLDHLFTKKSGGSDKPTNLVVACRRCNDVRHNMTLGEWATYAQKHLDVKVDPKAIKAQAAKGLPDIETAKRMQATIHESIRQDHAGREGETHKAAAMVHKEAAEHLRGGKWSDERAQAARVISIHAHTGQGWAGVQRDEKGRWVAA